MSTTNTDSNDLFLRASRVKLRFSSRSGLLTAEDLWDLSLEALNTVAVTASRRLKDLGEESFLEKASETQEQKQLKHQLEILKTVIEIKQGEVKARKERVEKQQKRAQLVELKEKKQFDAMAAMSLEDLDKQLAELGE